MRKQTQMDRGKVIPWKMKADEEQLILDWFNAQSTYVDSLRFLVQQEIALNGIRNLQSIIPAVRDIDAVRKMLSTPQMSLLSEKIESAHNFNKESATDKITYHINEDNDYDIEKAKQASSTLLQSNDSMSPSSHLTNTTDSTGKPSISPATKPAGKTFSIEAIKSYG